MMVWKDRKEKRKMERKEQERECVTGTKCVKILLISSVLWDLTNSVFPKE